MRRRRVAALLLPGVLVLAGCGGGATASTSSASGDASSGAVQDGSGQGGPAGQGGFGAAPGGGVFGLIAAVSGTTMQVQADVQTAVSWTDATTVSRQVTSDLSAVTVGSCVVAMVDDATADTPAATSVAVSEPVDGRCSAAGFGGGGMPPGMSGGDGSGLPSDFPTDMPSGFPTDMPSGAVPGGGASGAPGGGFGGAIVAGSVTAVDAGSVTVEQESGSTTVSVGADATVTATRSADATAIAVGLCVSVRGETDDRGGMTATALTLSDSVDGACTGGRRGA